MHLGVGHKSYRAHKTSLALMLLALALFVVAALLPLSANIFAVLGACPVNPALGPATSSIEHAMMLKATRFSLVDKYSQRHPCRFAGCNVPQLVVCRDQVPHDYHSVLVCAGALMTGALCMGLVPPLEQPPRPKAAIALQVLCPA